jgi:peroxiredoxin
MKKSHLLLISGFALALLLGGCNPGEAGGTAIKGTINGASELLIARIGTDNVEYLDTLALDNGKFSYSPEVNQPELWMLEVPNGLRLSLFMEPGEQIELSANFDDPGYEYTVEGSSGSARILSINRVMAKLMDGLDSLNEVNNAATQQENYPTVRNKLDSAYRRHLEQTQNTLVGMLEEDPGNLTNLFIFPLGVGNQQLLPADKYFEQYESSLAAMEERYPENPHVLRFAQRMTQMQEQMEAQREFMQAEQNAAVGMPVPDMTMKDVDGKDRSLSDLKGKVVLVDFWAAWCRPCRAENPNVVKMYNRFHDRGFEIYSVSLDGLPNQPNAKDAWLNAIKDDGLIWENHVSDLQGWSSSAIGIYGFQSIPFTLLVDRDGIIIERGLRGPALENAIEKAL